MRLAKITYKLLVTIGAAMLILLLITYMDIVSNNLEGMNGGMVTYTLSTTEPILNWLIP